MAQVRGFLFFVTCIHGEASSNTNVAVDFVYWYGALYFDYTAGPLFIEQGNGYCQNCTGGYWKSTGYLMGPGSCTIDTYGLHLFMEGEWSWQPATLATYGYPGSPP